MFDRYIALHARNRPDAPAIRMAETVVSFAAFDRDIDATAAALSSLTIGADEAVSIAMADPYCTWVVVLALARLGIGSASAEDRRWRQVVGDGSRRADELTLRLGTIAPASAPVTRKTPDPKSIARVLQSSGTTGEQKRVAMSWSAIDAAIRNAPITYGAPEGVWLASTGIDTIFGLVLTLACWATGNCALLGMDGRLVPAQLATTRPRLIALVPDQLQRLMDDLPDDFDRFDLRVVSGGGPVSPELARRTRERLTDDLRSVYGCAETGAVAIAGRDLLETTPGAAGYVLPGVEVETVGEDGAPLPAGQPGRIRVHSNRVATAYLGRVPGQAETLADGWFQSNDLGQVAPDGMLTIDGRADDIMNLGGHKILPAWIEQAALQCPGVREAAAFAVPDEQGMDRCWLALIKTDEFDPAQLRALVRDQLKWLTWIGVMPVDRLPRNAMGKVERHRLRDRVLADRQAKGPLSAG